MTGNIHTTFDKILGRSDKELLLKQKGVVVWLTGLSGSGKTTIAAAAEKLFYADGKFTQVLDGDNVRTGINNNLGFSADDRKENIRRIAETAKLFKEAGVITFCCFVSPVNELRKMAREIIGEKDFIHVFVSTSLNECERRDVKGLYARARKGEIKDFTGIDAPFEIPADAELELNTEGKTIEETSRILYDFIKRKTGN